MKVAQAVFHPDRSTSRRPEQGRASRRIVPGDGSVYQKAYTFGLSHPDVSAVISNMVDEKQVRENLAVVAA